MHTCWEQNLGIAAVLAEPEMPPLPAAPWPAAKVLHHVRRDFQLSWSTPSNILQDVSHALSIG